MVKHSTILIRNPTRERLKHVAYKGQTYDDIINYLIDLKIRGIQSVQKQAHDKVESIQLSPTPTGQSLASPGQSVGQKSIQGGCPPDG